MATHPPEPSAPQPTASPAGSPPAPEAPEAPHQLATPSGAQPPDEPAAPAGSRVPGEAAGPVTAAAGGSVDPFAPEGVVWTSVSPSLIRARYFALAIWLALPLIGAIVLGIIFGGWVWTPTVVLLLLVVWILWLVPRQVRAIGYAERAEDLLVRKGVMFRSLVVVPYGRMQFTDVASGPITRGLGIAQVQLHTAAAATDATIPGLPVAEAARLKDRLTQLGESRLAGL